MSEWFKWFQRRYIRHFSIRNTFQEILNLKKIPKIMKWNWVIFFHLLQHCKYVNYISSNFQIQKLNSNVRNKLINKFWLKIHQTSFEIWHALTSTDPNWTSLLRSVLIRRSFQRWNDLRSPNELEDVHWTKFAYYLKHFICISFGLSDESVNQLSKIGHFKWSPVRIDQFCAMNGVWLFFWECSR